MVARTLKHIFSECKYTVYFRFSNVTFVFIFSTTPVTDTNLIEVQTRAINSSATEPRNTLLLYINYFSENCKYEEANPPPPSSHPKANTFNASAFPLNTSLFPPQAPLSAYCQKVQ